MEGMFRVTVHGRISAAAEDFLLQVEKREETAPLPVLTLRGMLTERLAAAAEEIVGLFERTVAEHERRFEWSERARRMYEAALTPQVRLNRVDLRQQQMMVIGEDTPKQAQRSPKRGNMEGFAKRVTVQKPRICSLCDQTFNKEELMEKHLLVHLRGTPLIGKGFSNLSRRLSAIHQFMEKPFKCTECDKTFSTKVVLKTHMLFHTGQAPLSCPFCGKGFRYNASMKKHMKVHIMGPKPFRRPKGGNQLISKRRKRSRVKVHAGVSQFSLDRHHRSFQTEEKEAPTEQQQSPAVDQSDSELPFFEAKPNAVLMSQERRQLQGSEETDIRFILTSVTVKSEEDEEKAQSLQLHQCDTDENRVNWGETEAPAADSGPDQQLQPGPGVKVESFSQTMKDSKENVKQEIGEHQARLNPGTNNPSMIIVEDETDKEFFVCSLCDRTFIEKEEMEKHLLAHDRRKPPSLPKCSQGLKRRKMRKKPFSCNECGQGFISQKSRSIHMSVHSRERQFTCTECRMSYYTKKGLKGHMVVHSGEDTLRCTECGKKNSSEHSLKNHLKIHAGLDPLACTICVKHFPKKHMLKRHMSSHEDCRPCTCPECGETFDRMSSLILHRRVHREDWPFCCSLCDERFQVEEQLQEHMIVHVEQQPLSYSVCAEDSSDQSSTNRQVSVRTKEKSFSCTTCGKTFSTANHLRSHVKVHAPTDVPFLCSECGFRCSAKSTFQNHMTRHIREKPFSCPKCRQRFKRYNDYKVHMLYHTMKYSCVTCDERFRLKGELKQHLTTHRK